MLEHLPCSAEPPAASTSPSRAVLPGPIRLKPATPLYDELLLDLEHADLLDYIQQQCFSGDLRFVTESGAHTPEAMPFSCKMENLLQVVLAQRRKIVQAAGLDESQLSQHRATPSQMKTRTNAWRKDVRAWMCPSKCNDYFNLTEAKRHQEAHQLGKRCFSTYYFQISGCRFLLNKLIELPIIGNANRNTSMVVRQLLQDFEEHKMSDAYKAAVSRSKKRLREHERLSRHIWWARYSLQRGRDLSAKVAKGLVDFCDLSWKDQELVQNFDYGKAKESLSALEARKSPAYRGSHVEATTCTPGLPSGSHVEATTCTPGLPSDT